AIFDPCRKMGAAEQNFNTGSQLNSSECERHDAGCAMIAFQRIHARHRKPRKDSVAVFAPLVVAVLHKISCESGALTEFARHVDLPGTLRILIDFLKRHEIRVHLVNDRRKQIHIYATVSRLAMVDVVSQYAKGE